MNIINLFCFFFLFALSALVARATEPLSPADAQTLEQIEATLSSIKTIEASFEQTKELAIFKNKIILKGWLALNDEEQFAWHVMDPLTYSLVVNDGTIVQWDADADKIQKTSLRSNPVLGVVFEQLSQWFSGQYKNLTERYTVEVQQVKPAKVRFTPLEGTPEQRVIKSVLVSFSTDDRYLDNIQIDEISGDQTTLTFYDTVLNEPIASDAWQVNPGPRS